MTKRLTFEEWKDGDSCPVCFPEVDGEEAFHAHDEYMDEQGKRIKELQASLAVSVAKECKCENVTAVNENFRSAWLGKRTLLEKRIEKLRVALEFYGDHDNWQDIRDNCNINFQTITNEDDFIYGNVGQIYCGEIAREALNENK